MDKSICQVTVVVYWKYKVDHNGLTPLNREIYILVCLWDYRGVIPSFMGCVHGIPLLYPISHGIPQPSPMGSRDLARGLFVIGSRCSKVLWPSQLAVPHIPQAPVFRFVTLSPPSLCSCPHELTSMMSSSSTAHRHRTGDRINATGWLSMVSCRACAKKSVACKMSTLKEVCGECYRSGSKECVPVELPLPDYGRIDKEIARLEREDREAEKAERKAFDAMAAARAKRDRLRRQKDFLLRREQKIVDASGQYVQEIEALEAAEDLNFDLSMFEDRMLAGSSHGDWGAMGLVFDDSLVNPETVVIPVTSAG
jgi:hypothetical protein